MARHKRRRHRGAFKVRGIGKPLLTVAAVLLVMRILCSAGLTMAVDQAFHDAAGSQNSVNKILGFELGNWFSEADTGILETLGGWQAAVIAESALLRSSQDEVAVFLAASSGQNEDIPEETENIPSSEASDTNKVEDAEDIISDDTADDSLIEEKTLIPVDTEEYDYADGIYINNDTSLSVDVATLMEGNIGITLDDNGPQILIIHTHGSEAYAPDGDDVYTPTDPDRTEDKTYNVIRIGDEIAKIFEGRGITVVHDRNLYDYPSYSGCYARALTAIETYLDEYPSIKIVIDIHRDALTSGDGVTYKTIADFDGEKVAQVMLVMGTNDSGLSHPNWKENLKLAIKIQAVMNKKYPTLARPINLRSSRFNQHATTGSMLVEIGSNGNTLQEALAAAELFADAAADVILSLN